MSGPKPVPEVMHLLFERDVFLGAFVKRDAAERWAEARAKGGHGPHEIHEFYRMDRIRNLESVAMRACEYLERCGKPYETAARRLLRKALKELRETK